MGLKLSPIGRKYGAKQDTSDPRDWGLNSAPVFRLKLGTLPPVCDLTEWCGPIKDQGQEGSCTGHAYSSIREFVARKFQGKDPILSPQFLYVQELLSEGTFPNDDGAMPRTGCVILDTLGCCEESVNPYVAGQIEKSTDGMLENAKLWMGGAYHRITSLADLLSCLNSGYPASIGFQVYESFERSDWLKSGVMPIPKDGEMFLGGHEVFACGYDLKKRVVLIQNSWGKDWALDGRFYMPFDFIKNATFVSDIWMCHLGRPWVKK